MHTITVPAIYHDGVLQPQVKLDLPENTPVQVQITPLPTVASTPPVTFGSLAGIWGHLSEAEVEQMEAALALARRQTADKVKQLSRELANPSG
jgi:predicted DNA-binding antitoxin AbrB/MazE fold protein